MAKLVLLDYAIVDHKDAIEARWDKTFGDRLNELVFIGQEMDEAAIRAGLEQCLCNEAEIAAWQAGLFTREDAWPIGKAEPEAMHA